MLQFAISSSPMIHLVPHPPLPSAPAKNLKKMALISPVPREVEDNAYAIFLGKHKGFQGQHLPRLSINFVVINKDLEKMQTQLYYIKVGFCYDQVYNDIRVVLSTK